MGDSKLGDYFQLRFLPQRFDLDGAGFDQHGVPCHKLACPNCHLPIPRALLHLSNFFVSIAGAPASGKSYFLASMIWSLRKTMAKAFSTNFTDADPDMNKRIKGYESAQFMGSDNPNELVAIAKTDVSGDIYNQSFINGISTTLAQPFIFTIEPMPKHPLLKQMERAAQAVCLYDNAGESFLPGADLSSLPVTRHLARSNTIMFVFDPTQDVRFRTACKEHVDDPQMNPTDGAGVRKSPVPQETVLNNVITQMRTLIHISPREKIKIPLIVVLTKWDAWKQLTKFPHYREPWKKASNMPISAYNAERVEEYSNQLRELLLDLIPNLVSTAETASEKVTYIAVSATGGPPELGEPDINGIRPLAYRPINVNPIWSEVPFFHSQFLAGKYCIPVGKRVDK
ncbi:MAG: hypothetical protein LBQ50_08440 [Planctomycetaceae bacterium]|jgi:hypothetical protein|nr:hypothetical protein [Planctomycetaceae bacterium]